jgi:uncharacterized membrane protein
MIRYAAIVLLGILVLTAAVSAPNKKVSFAKDVMPLVKTKCLPCHAQGNSNPGHYGMESYEAIVKGGKHGAAVVAGRPEVSILIKKMSATPSFGQQMPVMTKAKMSPDEMKIFETWIKEGAKKK